MKNYSIHEMFNSELWQVLFNDFREEISASSTQEEMDEQFTVLGLNWHMVMNGKMAYDAGRKMFIIFRPKEFYDHKNHL